MATATATTHSLELGNFRFAPKGPELAGSAVGAVVSTETNSGVEGISAELSLALKSGCPATGDRRQAETRFEWAMITC